MFVPSTHPRRRISSKKDRVAGSSSSDSPAKSTTTEAIRAGCENASRGATRPATNAPSRVLLVAISGNPLSIAKGHAYADRGLLVVVVVPIGKREPRRDKAGDQRAEQGPSRCHFRKSLINRQRTRLRRSWSARGCSRSDRKTRAAARQGRRPTRRAGSFSLPFQEIPYQSPKDTPTPIVVCSWL